jgi:UDP-N-acetylglucosamine--N-acetylmuramyl-(pentapeptide) pyrophosphoryl-undecaprenol N-acetylglucosamine transferase
MMPESKFTPEALAEQIMTVLDTPEGAQKMANAARTLGRADAAAALAGLVEELAMTGEYR